MAVSMSAFPPASELVAFHLPLFLAEGAAQTASQLLGGPARISSAVEGAATHAELWLRPGDASSRPLVGTRAASSAMLLRVTRTPHARSVAAEAAAPCGAATGAGETGMETVEILGHVASGYHFDALADFQYLPSGVPLSVSTSTVADILESLPGNLQQPIQLRQHAASAAAAPQPGGSSSSIPYCDLVSQVLNLTPVAYSRVDRPQPFAYRPAAAAAAAAAGAVGAAAFEAAALGPSSSSSSIAAPPSGGAKRGRLPTVEPHHVVLTAGVDVPSQPPAGYQGGKLKPAVVTLLARLHEAFAARPVWSYSCLCMLLPALLEGGALMRSALAPVAYFVRSGAFRQTWIRLGYDPRTSADSRVYQVIDCRLPASHAEMIPRSSNKHLKTLSGRGGSRKRSRGEANGGDSDDDAARDGEGGGSNNALPLVQPGPKSGAGGGLLLAGSTVSARSCFQLIDLHSIGLQVLLQPVAAGGGLSQPSLGTAEEKASTQASSDPAAALDSTGLARGAVVVSSQPAAPPPPASGGEYVMLAGGWSRLPPAGREALLRVIPHQGDYFDKAGGWIPAWWTDRARGVVVQKMMARVEEFRDSQAARGGSSDAAAPVPHAAPSPPELAPAAAAAGEPSC